MLVSCNKTLRGLVLPLVIISLSGCLSSREKPYTTMEREAYGSLDTANRASRRLDYDGAASYYERACNQFAAIDAMGGFILCNIDTAALYLKLGKNREAEDLLHQAIKLADQHRELSLIGTAHLYLAFMHLGSRDYAKAQKEVDLGLANLSDREEKRRGLQYRAEAFLETGEPEAAIRIAEDTLGSSIPGRDSYACTIIARAQMKLGHPEMAIRSAEKAVRLDKDEGIPDLLAYDYELLSLIYESSGDLTRAIETAERSLQVNLATNRVDPARRLIGRLIGLHRKSDRDNGEMERLNRILRRIEKLK